MQQFDGRSQWWKNMFSFSSLLQLLKNNNPHDDASCDTQDSFVVVILRRGGIMGHNWLFCYGVVFKIGLISDTLLDEIDITYCDR